MANSPAATAFPHALAERLRELERETGDPRLRALAEEAGALGECADRKSVERFRDRLSTCLMDVFRITGSPQAFGLLYELNYRVFLAVIGARLRKFYFPLDPHDVLQEVFFNIYRYPHNFQAEKDESFRHWAGMIIRNTVYKATREKDREFSHEVQDEEIDARPDRVEKSPLALAIREESAELCSKAYEVYLRLYLAAYQQLSAREKRALHLVEVEGRPYKETAAELGIKLENLKMVVFRARKKILRTLDRILAQTEAWGRERELTRPARAKPGVRENAAGGAA